MVDMYPKSWMHIRFFDHGGCFFHFLKLISRKLWNTIKSSLKISICWNIIGHLSIMELLVGKHIKVTGTGQTEQDILLFTGFFTFECFVNGNTDGM